MNTESIEQIFLVGFKEILKQIVGEETEIAKKKVESRLMEEALNRIPEIMSRCNVQTTEKEIIFHIR